MRIGTWNLEGRWNPAHREALERADCDVWLLTEVAAGVELSGYAAVRTVADMRKGKGGAAAIRRSGEAWGLHWPTVGLDHRLNDVRTIDHVGVPTGWGGTAERTELPRSLSDHDLYILELEGRTSLT